MASGQKCNKLVIFDLDGVLLDSRETHYQSLNMALEVVNPDWIISRHDHLSKYDGLSTTEKLKMLDEKYGLSNEDKADIWRLKQEYTNKLLEKTPIDYNLIDICKYLKSKGYKIAVASNAIRNTVKISLLKLGIMPYVDYFQSNEDVKHGKPYPEMYWNCMIAMKALPDTTIIVEDSHIGREGALSSKATLLPIEGVYDLTMDKIEEAVTGHNISKPNIPWRDKKLNVLIPMAGAGSRFAAKGYTFPKPLIEVMGKPMIQFVVENLNIEANYIYIVQKAHYEKYNLKYLLNLITPGCKIVQVDGLTEGAACTTLLAKEYIDNENPLVIANSDQYVEWNANKVMYSFAADGIDGGILTFKATHPKWSYASVNDQGFVKEVAEKKVISDNATVGIYYWKKGSDYVKYAEQMIANNTRTNGEFYVCPVFNEAINDGKKIKIKQIDRMWGIGTPEDLDTFLKEHEK